MTAYDELPICDAHGRRCWDSADGPWCPLCETHGIEALADALAAEHHREPRVLTFEEACAAGVFQWDGDPEAIDPALEPA